MTNFEKENITKYANYSIKNFKFAGLNVLEKHTIFLLNFIWFS